MLARPPEESRSKLTAPGKRPSAIVVKVCIGVGLEVKTAEDQ